MKLQHDTEEKGAGLICTNVNPEQWFAQQLLKQQQSSNASLKLVREEAGAQLSNNDNNIQHSMDQNIEVWVDSAIQNDTLT